MVCCWRAICRYARSAAGAPNFGIFQTESLSVFSVCLPLLPRPVSVSFCLCLSLCPSVCLSVSAFISMCVPVSVCLCLSVSVPCFPYPIHSPGILTRKTLGPPIRVMSNNPHRILSKQVSWCFTPSQPVRLHEGDHRIVNQRVSHVAPSKHIS